MASRKDKLSRAAHIKRNTHGTSNEISFSVLDAAKMTMDERHGEARRIQQLGKIDLFTGEQEPDYQVLSFSGREGEVLRGDVGVEKAAPSQSPQSGADAVADIPLAQPSVAVGSNGSIAFGDSRSYEYEVARKKAVRRFKRGMRAAAVVAVVAVVAVCVAFGVQGVLAQRSAFDATIRTVISDIEVSDSSLVPLNEVLSDPTAEKAEESAVSAKQSAEASKKALEQAQGNLEEAKGKAASSDDAEVATQAQRDIDARKDMLTSGLAVLEELDGALSAFTSLEEAWNLVEESDSSARSAASLVSQASDEALEKAAELMRESIAKLGESSSKVEEAAAACPEADLSLVREFVSLRTEALGFELEAVEAVIDGNTQEARTLQSQYEEAEEKARQKASEISDVKAPVLSAYKSSAAESIERYEEARSKVAVADEYLRDYAAGDLK